MMETLDSTSEDVIKTDTTLDMLNNLSPRDVLKHFNKNIYPAIKEKYFPTPIQPEASVQTAAVVTEVKKSFFDIFRKKSVAPIKEEIKEIIKEPTKEDIKQEEIGKDTLYKLHGIEIAKGLFEFVVGEHTHDIQRINLFLGVMWAEMETTAYMNAWLHFKNCADVFEKEGKKDKSRIIRESLKLCDNKFADEFTIIEFTKDHLIFKNGYGTTIQSKEDFLKKDVSA